MTAAFTSHRRDLMESGTLTGRHGSTNYYTVSAPSINETPHRCVPTLESKQLRSGKTLGRDGHGTGFNRNACGSPKSIPRLDAKGVGVFETGKHFSLSLNHIVRFFQTCTGSSSWGSRGDWPGRLRFWVGQLPAGRRLTVWPKLSQRLFLMDG